ncbi:Uu.00g051570.m01.CDS01 [Anthostomella pinea]|uniref:Uu.00g051570.m01.CDS01 n=1 Tax=Anthostomella pinea TaxID=933095 RepID=A0AAI8VTQ3_9PEZI|nr:Uu.00g051570.m01.CDS01 [Anthostomella pinea]
MEARSLVNLFGLWPSAPLSVDELERVQDNISKISSYVEEAHVEDVQKVLQAVLSHARRIIDELRDLKLISQDRTKAGVNGQVLSQNENEDAGHSDNPQAASSTAR